MCCACSAYTYVHLWCMCTAHYNSASAPQIPRTRYLVWKQSELAGPLALEPPSLHTSHFHTKLPSHPSKITTISGANISMHPSLEKKQPRTTKLDLGSGAGMPTCTTQVSRQMSSFIVSPWRKEKTSGRSVIASASLRRPQSWLLRTHAHSLY